MKPNYGFAKRQRELAKKQKKEEKRLKKLAEDGPQAVEGESPVESQHPADPGSPQGN
jgi:hypothetical protein